MSPNYDNNKKIIISFCSQMKIIIILRKMSIPLPYLYLVIVIDNSSSKLNYSNVIIQRGVFVGRMDICLFHLYQLFVWSVVSNCINFYLKIEFHQRFLNIFS